jgi:uncharacterized membrane protein YidH (DUF202 family)
MEHNFFKRYVCAYLLVYVGLSILFAATAFVPVLDKIPDSFGVVIAMISALWPGQRFAEDYGRKPDKSEKRRFAATTLGIVTVLSCVVLAVLWMFFIPAADKDETLRSLAGLPAWGYVAIVALVGALYYWVIVLGFCMGAKNQIKAMEKKRAKGGV